MYTNYCRQCGCPFNTSNYNLVFCSGHCSSNYQSDLQKQRDNYSSSSSTSSSSTSYPQAGGGIPIEFVIFVAAAGTAWEAMQKWQEFEPVTKHILLMFYYIFYKPLYFSAYIYDYLSSVEQSFGGWFFFAKWVVIIFYIFFMLGLYLAVITLLNEKRLAWVWILFLLSPAITHGIWYFFIR